MPKKKFTVSSVVPDSLPVPQSENISASVPPTVRGLQIPEASAYSGMTIWAIRSLIWDRKIPYILAGKRYLILRDDMDAYLQSQRYKVRA